MMPGHEHEQLGSSAVAARVASPSFASFTDRYGCNKQGQRWDRPTTNRRPRWPPSRRACWRGGRRRAWSVRNQRSACGSRSIARCKSSPSPARHHDQRHGREGDPDRRGVWFRPGDQITHPRKRDLRSERREAPAYELERTLLAVLGHAEELPERREPPRPQPSSRARNRQGQPTRPLPQRQER